MIGFKLGLLNTSIITNVGSYELRDISLEDARMLVDDYINSNGIESAIGHQATADIMTKLLRVKIDVNRIQFCQEPGQTALIFKLNGRLEEGKILDIEDINKIGFKFQLLINKTK